MECQAKLMHITLIPFLIPFYQLQTEIFPILDNRFKKGTVILSACKDNNILIFEFSACTNVNSAYFFSFYGLPFLTTSGGS